MELKKHIRLLSCSTFFCGAVLTAYSLSDFLKQPKKITINYGFCFSDQTEKFLDNFINKLLDQQSSAEETLKQIQSIIPAVKKVTINRKNPMQTHVTLHNDTPWIAIKNPSVNLIMSDSGNYTAQKYYDISLLKNLLSITIVQKTFTPDHQNMLYNWSKNLPKNFFNHAQVTWYKPTYITIQSLHHPKILIITNIHKKYDAELEATMKNIYGMPTIQQKKEKWHADTRFNNQIVLSKINKKRRAQ